MRLTAHLIAISLLLLLCHEAAAQEFGEPTTVELDHGLVWCIPVYDGQHLRVSSESPTNSADSGGISVFTFDMDFRQVGDAVMVADASDTGGDAIADHKHIMVGAHHFIVFADGGDQADDLFLLKLDRDLQRVGIVQVVDDDPPTNDMMLVSDGERISVGKFLPGFGHRMYVYNLDLQLQGTVDVGGGDNRHANGASATWATGINGPRFELIAPQTLAPGEGGAFYRLSYDADWQLLSARQTILEDPGQLQIVSGLSYMGEIDRFVVHYSRASDDKGGSMFRARYDADWQLLSKEKVLKGKWNRPHSVVVGDQLVLGYDGQLKRLSSFPFIGAADTKPSKPKKLRKSVGDTGVSLTWRDRSDNEAGFDVLRRVKPDDFEVIARLGPDVVSWLDTTTTPGSKHCYRVQAFNSLGMSGRSNRRCVTT